MWKNCKKVLTIHDLYIWLNDSEDISPKTFRDKKKRELEKVAPNLDAIITGSENSKKDINKVLGISKEKIFVTQYGVSNSFQYINVTIL